MKNPGFSLSLIAFFCILSFHGFAGDEADTAQILLLENKDIQIASTQAINNMYNFKFDSADKQFRWIKQRYPEHPIAYFLLGLSHWWKINISIENEQYDKSFLGYIDTAIHVASKLYDNPRTRIEGAFFLSAGYGFQGRLYGERGQWTKATVASKNSLKYFKVCRNNSNLSPELMYGDALFNYFSVWIPENYPVLKPVMAFFPKGDKALGLKQLETVSRNAFYTRTEAQYFLMHILGSYENDLPGALIMAEYLHKTFPDNSYFHRSYARFLYSTGRGRDADFQSRQILARIDSGMFGYENTEGRYAAFYLGQISEQRKNAEEAAKFYKLCIDFARKGKATESGYYHYANLFLGQIAMKKGDTETARDYFRTVRKESKRKDAVNKKARDLLKDL
ncbi:MAG TPA: hypothetical protein VI583_14675 [Cyclobacteriaceae bacterium]|nr:hypothetical protein [Cyclobacteriaceae bacterium]